MSLVAVSVPSGDPEDARGEAAEAFDAVFRSYAPRVKALADRRLPGRNAGDDVVQEVFLRVYRSFDAIDPDRPIWPWLKTVAHNVCIDIIRQSRRHTDRDAALDDVEERSLTCAKDDPSEAHAAALRRVSIEAALAMVNPRQRRVVVLKDVEGWDTEEVAQLEGVTVEALKSTLKRGRQTFRTTYLALAAKNGLLGGFAVLGTSLTAAFKRVFKARSADANTLNALVPIANVVPIIAVLAIAGGAFVMSDASGGAHTVELPGTGRSGLAVSARDINDVVQSAKVAVHAQTPSGSVSLDADPATGAKAAAETKVVTPLGEGGNVEAEARFDRGDDVARLEIELAIHDPEGTTRVRTGQDIRCDSAIYADARCAATQQAFDAISDLTAQP